MNFVRGLLMARSHFAFLGGLGIALATIATLTPATSAVTACSPMPRDVSKLVAVDKPAPVRATGAPLDERERRWATVAWSYFENNTVAGTGLVNSFDGFASTTLWDLGSYAMALFSARDLGLIDEPTFDGRVKQLLTSLESLPLVDGIAPNKAYDTRSLAMVNYDNSASPNGIGWSALDIARLAVPFQMIAWRYPQHTAAVRSLLVKWKPERIVDDGQLIGAHRKDDGQLVRVQEGRFGYEQYAAKSLFLLGCDVSRAIRYDVDVDVTDVGGQKVLHDARKPAEHDGTHNAVLSEPYVLEALEYGLDATTLPIASSVYRAQEKRAEATGILTAVSEDHLDRAPHFVYASVLNDGKPWAVFTPDGRDSSAMRSLSTKAAVGWSYVFGGAYADALRNAVDALAQPGKGFWAGRYEKDGEPNRALTANTNGIVLEALLYKTSGPLLRAARSGTSENSRVGAVR